MNKKYSYFIFILVMIMLTVGLTSCNNKADIGNRVIDEHIQAMKNENIDKLKSLLASDLSFRNGSRDLEVGPTMYMTLIGFASVDEGEANYKLTSREVVETGEDYVKIAGFFYNVLKEDPDKDKKTVFTVRKGNDSKWRISQIGGNN